MATICIVGLWHQATVMSACLADLGHQVCGVDDDEQTVALLNRGEPPVYEHKLKAILQRNLRAGRLKYTTDYREALQGAEFVYIAIDTPVSPDGQSDLSSIFDAACRVGQAMSGKAILIVSAQVPVGTCERVGAIVREVNPAAVLGVAYVPEFLGGGGAVDAFPQFDRFVVGTNDPAVAERIVALYHPLDRPIVITSMRTAEMAKHASNAFLATSVSFINEIADMCDEVDADVSQVAQIMKLDRRIGKDAFLRAGLGFGGWGLVREIGVLQRLGQQHGCDTPMMDAVMAINQGRDRLVEQRLRRVYDSLEGLQVGTLGLTYKSGISTLLGSIALDIIRRLVAQGVRVKAFDPLARLDEVADLPPFESCPDPYTVAQGSDALVFVTGWVGFDDLDLTRLRAAMRRPVFIDTRNWFDPAEMSQLGFIYLGIGRGLSLEGGQL